ncbi:hypothetical protein J2S09_002533 [Bacillus fengqiuensis]|nr:hypothetical protein [Bacillus fengqiuensis]
MNGSLDRVQYIPGSINEYLDLLHGKNEYSDAEERWTDDIDLCISDGEDNIEDAWDL